ncbi:uncharacterized protein LOC129944024 [Eupeodes corollae]|uniref:uncharacterized protein LOC129944024 n=1 Tax=Eupeodes corollae TaxID=290404 RepID=UPI002493363D|nr:uncharacterized protein LOC129944024 [Eupeodes corollae]
MSTHKTEVYKTGGGPSTSALSCLEEKIAGMGGLQFTPEDNVYDSNADFNSKVESDSVDVLPEYLEEFQILTPSNDISEIIALSPPAPSTSKNFVQKARAKGRMTKRVGTNLHKCDEICSLKKKNWRRSYRSLK